MKGGCRRRFVRAWVTDREAMAGLLATDAVRMQCSVQACATSVHNSVKHVVQGPHAMGAWCAVRTVRWKAGRRWAPRPPGDEREGSEERVERRLGCLSAACAASFGCAERDSIVSGKSY